MKLVAMLMAYNEHRSGNLIRCLNSLTRYCDNIIVYDDASDDGSQHVYRAFNCNVIQGETNDFKNELSHKQQQLELCKNIGADWIFRIDADEVLDERGIISGGFRQMLENAQKPSFAFHTINLWRSPCYYRIDNSFNDVVFNRLWRCLPDLHFNIMQGLHLTNYPVGVTSNEDFAPYEIIHYGFSSNQAIIDKYNMYKTHGQNGIMLDRLINEMDLKLKRSKQEWFQEELPAHKFEEIFDRPLKSFI